MEKKEKKPVTASQRLEGLEAAVSMLDQSLANITSNLQKTVDAVNLISKRVEAIVRAADAGSLTSQSVSAQVVNMNIEELKEKVDSLISQGVAVPSEQIQENSFVVGRELDPSSKDIQNPRLQFPVFGLKPETKEKLMGKKVGDLIDIEEGRNTLEITELYNIVIPAQSQGQTNLEGTQA